MLRALMVLFFAVTASEICAQKLVVENQSSLTFFYSQPTPFGNSTITNNGLTYPGLISNYQKGIAFGVQYAQQIKSIYWAGVRFSRFQFSDWKFNETSEVFKGSTLSINSLHLTFIAKSKFSERGMRNKLRFFGLLAPGVYQIAADMPNAVAGYSKSVRVGLMLSAGVEYSVNNKLALMFEAGYHYVPAQSDVYFENNFQWYNINFGIQFRMSRNRNYLNTIYD